MNLYYLLGGILATVISVTHAFWGEKNLSPELYNSNLSEFSKGGIYISYHQITWTLLASGLTLIMISQNDKIPGIDYVAMLIDAITIGNFSVFFVIGALKNRELITLSVPQIILFVVLISLISLGIYL